MPTLRRLAPLSLALCLTQASAEQATSVPIQSSVQALCDTMKACTQAQVEAEKAISAAMQKMLDQMSAEACQALHASFLAMPEEPALIQLAQACLDSMSSRSCSELETLGSGTTPACEAFEAQTKKYQ